MAGLSTIQFYWNLYKKHRKGLEFSKDYQLKLYNWFPPFFPQDLWLSKFVEGRALLREKDKMRAGVFTICGPEWAIRRQPCELKIFFARENLAHRHKWHDFMLNEPCIDLSIGFDDINDNPKYIHIPFWIMWTLDPMETYDSIKAKVQQWNSADSKSYADRKFCSFLCSHGDAGRERILNELSTIDKVDSAGRWMHNDDSLKSKYNDDKIEWNKHYRFNLTPENSNAPGYVTEKLLDTISSGCIPIYWGGDNHPDPEIFNQDAIIFFDMNKENPDTIKLVQELNSDAKRYMEFACQKRLVEGAEDVIWEYYNLLEKKLTEIIKSK